MITVADSQYVAVGSSSAKFADAMDVGFLYRFTSNVDCWVVRGATGGSAAADDNGATLVIAGQVAYLSTDAQATTGFVHVIRDTADGKATLTRILGG